MWAEAETRSKADSPEGKSALLVSAKAHSSWWLALEDTYAEPENLLEYNRAGVGKADLSTRPYGLGRGDKRQLALIPFIFIRLRLALPR